MEVEMWYDIFDTHRDNRMNETQYKLNHSCDKIDI